MNPTGRPRSLDPAKRAEICSLVAAGHTVTDVARLVGCNVKTIRRQAGRDDQFRRELATAELASRNDPLKMMQRAARKHWRAAAWLLERTEPARYAKQPSVAYRPEQVEDSFSRLMEAALRVIDDKELRRCVFRHLKQAAQEETCRLLAPPEAFRKSTTWCRTPTLDYARFDDYVDAATHADFEGKAFRASQGAAGDSAPKGFCPVQPQPPRPKTPPSENLEKSAAPPAPSAPQAGLLSPPRVFRPDGPKAQNSPPKIRPVCLASTRFSGAAASPSADKIAAEIGPPKC